MVRTLSYVALGLLVATRAAGPAAAQTQDPAPQVSRANLSDLRHQIYVMEGALVRAVQFGAQQVNREIRTLSPELFSLAGDAQARGVYLEGYGVFFDVGVPILRQSMVWSLKTMLEQDDRSLRETIRILRQQLNNERDPSRRADLQSAITRLELQLGPDQTRAAAPPAPAPGAPRGGAAQPIGGVGAAMMPPETPPATPGAPASPGAPKAPIPDGARAVLMDPNRAYTESVQKALVDAMIDYAPPMLLGAEDWLTVAARDNEPRDSLAPQDPYEEVVTILLRIKGSDLTAYRAGKIDREEAKRRVQIKEF